MTRLVPVPDDHLSEDRLIDLALGESASPQERWMRYLSSAVKVTTSSGSLLKISPIKRALTTSSPSSAASTGKRVRMPVCIL